MVKSLAFDATFKKSDGFKGCAQPVCRCRRGVQESLMAKQANIAVVDDHESVRESLPDLLHILGFTARAFPSAEEFLASDSFRETDCLILDVAMRGMSGPQLQTELKRLGSKIPIIFITAQSDESLRQRLVEQGAVACLLKPFSDTTLQDALNQALRMK
jgi:FixJ family two-component response regulator